MTMQFLTDLDILVLDDPISGSRIHRDIHDRRPWKPRCWQKENIS